MVFFILCSILVEICGGVSFLLCVLIYVLLLLVLMIEYGIRLMFFWIFFFLKWWLIRCFIVNSVFFGLVIDWCLVGVLMSILLLFMYVMIDGVVCVFFEFLMILIWLFFMMVMYEFVVLRLILMIFFIFF